MLEGFPSWPLRVSGQKLPVGWPWALCLPGFQPSLCPLSTATARRASHLSGWGVQELGQLEQWLQVAEEDPDLDEELEAFIAKERKELSGSFCRSCGYCMPCPVGIEIRNCARMNMLLRRSPWQQYMTPEWQAKMNKIEDCLGCRRCASRCPYQLDTPNLLKYMLKDYREFYEAHKDQL